MVDIPLLLKMSWEQLVKFKEKLDLMIVMSQCNFLTLMVFFFEVIKENVSVGVIILINLLSVGSEGNFFFLCACKWSIV